VTKKGMSKIKRIYKSDRTDMLARRIRRFVNKRMFIVTKGLEGSPWVYGEDKLGRELRGRGIGGANTITTHETDIIWTLRERGMRHLRARLIKILGTPVRKSSGKTSDLDIKHFIELESSI
jgi:hypothetical protein